MKRVRGGDIDGSNRKEDGGHFWPTQRESNKGGEGERKCFSTL